MARPSSGVSTGRQNHHFSNRNRAVREILRQNSSPCASKTIGAERALIVVVGFPCMACIIFSHFYIFFHNLSRNALKRILLENQSVLKANAIFVFVQDWWSKTTFLGADGEWVHFDNFAPRLGKSTLRALQQLFGRLFWTTFLPKTGANHTAKCTILLNWVTKATLAEKQNS